MTVTSEEAGVGQPTREPSPRLTWQRLMVLSGVIAAVTTSAAAIYLTDIEGGIVALVFGISTWLFSSGRRRFGVTGLVLVSAVTLYFMGTAVATNIGGWAGAEGTLISLGLSAASTLVVIACVGWLLKRGVAASWGPWVAVGVVAAGLAAPLVAGVLDNQPEREPAGVSLVTENVAFDQTELSASAGSITVSLENRDLFWHTFTIEELDVDLRVPVSAQMTVTFDAAPGEYRFFCDIPGHPEAGMEGTLLVEGRSS